MLHDLVIGPLKQQRRIGPDIGLGIVIKLGKAAQISLVFWHFGVAADAPNVPMGHHTAERSAVLGLEYRPLCDLPPVDKIEQFLLQTGGDGHLSGAGIVGSPDTKSPLFNGVYRQFRQLPHPHPGAAHRLDQKIGLLFSHLPGRG